MLWEGGCVTIPSGGPHSAEMSMFTSYLRTMCCPQQSFYNVHHHNRHGGAGFFQPVLGL